MPPADVELSAESLIDISHESLIRNWKKLKTWVDEEAQSTATYKRLAERAELYKQGKEELLRDPGLQLALEWQEQHQPHEAWARRYHSGLAATVEFLQQSQKAQEDEVRAKEAQQQHELRRTRRTTIVFALAAIVALLLAFYAYQQKIITEEQQARAEKQQALAEEQEKTSRNLSYVANMNLAYQSFADGKLARGHDLLDTFLPSVDSPSDDQLREFDWYYLWKLNR